MFAASFAKVLTTAWGSSFGLDPYPFPDQKPHTQSEQNAPNEASIGQAISKLSSYSATNFPSYSCDRVFTPTGYDADGIHSSTFKLFPWTRSNVERSSGGRDIRKWEIADAMSANQIHPSLTRRLLFPLSGG